MMLNYISRSESYYPQGKQETEYLSKHDNFTSVFNFAYGSHTVV
jgi:hypothetical protein